jgi:hypothetical protein
MVFGGSAVETSNVKIVGGNVAMVLVMAVFYFAAATPLMRWLSSRGGD